jgi:hypothetical protein
MLGTIKKIVICDAHQGFEFLYVHTEDKICCIHFRPDGQLTGLDLSTIGAHVDGWTYTTVYDANIPTHGDVIREMQEPGLLEPPAPCSRAAGHMQEHDSTKDII